MNFELQVRRKMTTEFTHLDQTGTGSRPSQNWIDWGCVAGNSRPMTKTNFVKSPIYAYLC